MTTIFQRLNEELIVSRGCQLAALVEVSQLPVEARDALHADTRLHRYPLLVQPEFDNLRAIGPMLVTTSGDAIDNLQRLFDRQPVLRAGVVGWLSSAMPIDRLASHLSHANIVVGPEGGHYLLRYHAPHVLEALYLMQNAWSRAFFAPFLSWWALQSGGRWRRYPGAGGGSVPLAALHADRHLWSALNGGNSEPHAVLSRLQQLQPPVFQQSCPGMRLAQVEALLAEADAVALTRAVDRQDYVLLRLQLGEELMRDPRWHAALQTHRDQSLRLMEAWLSHS